MLFWISFSNLVLYIGNFAFIIFNTIAHLCRLKVTKPLIILFYILAYIFSISRILECTSRVFFPDLNYFDYQDISIGGVSRSLANASFTALGILIVVTMYQLATSLQLILGEVNETSAKSNHMAAFKLGIASIIVFSAMIVYIYVTH